MTQLPTKIRVDIRDQYDSLDAPVQKSLKKLREIIGYPVSCEIEWPMLWSELSGQFPDKATFVPHVVGVIQAWCEVFGTRLEDEKFAAWTEECLEKLDAVHSIKLYLEVYKETRIKTIWVADKPAFALLFPRNAVTPPTKAASIFETDFQYLFKGSEHTPGGTSASATKDDEWAAVDESGDTVSIRLRDPASSDSGPLPALDTLSRPDVLFQTLTPYLLHVTVHSSNQIVVQASHEPSLKLLSEYLKRWIKRDPRDLRKIPYLKVELLESHLGLGLNYDTLTIEPHDHNQRWNRISPVQILAFIEGVLGYIRVPSHGSGAGSFWEFRREAKFNGE